MLDDVGPHRTLEEREYLQDMARMKGLPLTPQEERLYIAQAMRSPPGAVAAETKKRGRYPTARTFQHQRMIVTNTGHFTPSLSMSSRERPLGTRR